MFNQLLYFVLRQHIISDNPDKDIIEIACDVLINCTHKNPTVSDTVPCVTDMIHCGHCVLIKKAYLHNMRTWLLGMSMFKNQHDYTCTYVCMGFWMYSIRNIILMHACCITIMNMYIQFDNLALDMVVCTLEMCYVINSRFLWTCIQNSGSRKCVSKFTGTSERQGCSAFIC